MAQRAQSWVIATSVVILGVGSIYITIASFYRPRQMISSHGMDHHLSPGETLELSRGLSMVPALKESAAALGWTHSVGLGEDPTGAFLAARFERDGLRTEASFRLRSGVGTFAIDRFSSTSLVNGWQWPRYVSDDIAFAHDAALNALQDEIVALVRTQVVVPTQGPRVHR
jgi:hypothetical protein